MAMSSSASRSASVSEKLRCSTVDSWPPPPICSRPRKRITAPSVVSIRLSTIDSLTGLFNRRALETRLNRELEQAQKYSTVLSCLMIDVDNFKLTNDTMGHQMGDLILAQLAGLLKREQRAIDLVARFGGEEFCVLLPLTGSGGARLLADRILRRVSSHAFGERDRPVPITVSIGVATYPADRVTDGTSLLRLADQNLLKAKADGRNRYRD